MSDEENATSARGVPADIFAVDARRRSVRMKSTIRTRLIHTTFATCYPDVQGADAPI